MLEFFVVNILDLVNILKTNFRSTSHVIKTFFLTDVTASM